MVEFTVHDESSAPDEARPALGLAKSQYEAVPNLFGVLAESPQAVTAYWALSDQFLNSSLPTDAKLVVLLTASRENRCSYCVAAYSALGAAQNVDESVIDAVRDDKPIDDAQLEAVRRFTALVVDNRGWVSDEDVQALLDAGFARRHVLDVITGVAMKTLSNYTNHLANTPLDKGFASYAWTADS
jgi:uncharacterized peroxidase-related enzyme